MSKVITIGNHKGGVGKTTSTINIGAGLYQKGKKVLLVDLDPQANLTTSLGALPEKPTIYEYLRGESNFEAPIKVLEGFDLMPASLNLSAAEIELSAEAGREYILKEILDPIRKQYDYIIIDAPPSLGLLTLNALVAADCVLIPLQAQYLAMQGLSKFVEVVEKIQQRLNKQLTIGGVFLTQYDARKVLNRNVLETVTSFFGENVFSTNIRENIALAEAPTAGEDIFRYAPKSKGAEDYHALAEEVLARC